MPLACAVIATLAELLTDDSTACPQVAQNSSTAAVIASATIKG